MEKIEKNNKIKNKTKNTQKSGEDSRGRDKNERH